MHFLQIKALYFASNFNEVCSNGQLAIIGSGNDLAPALRRVITWTNDDQDLRRNIASLGHTEFL